MSIFYRVNRLGQLHSGMSLGLRRYDDVQPPEMQVHVDKLFPDGLSWHGEAYYLKNEKSVPDVASAQLEILYEYVRRSTYPRRPSRFQVWFASDSIEEAEFFRTKYGDKNATIWQVTADEYFRANMNLITIAQKTILSQSYLAHLYWEGITGPAELSEPHWEYLLVPPVRVLAQIG